MNLIDGDLFTKTPLFNNDDKFSFSTNFKIGIVYILKMMVNLLQISMLRKIWVSQTVRLREKIIKQ
ncbi:MAG: hypothetical protein CM15mV11_2640 [Caudoviricetes sp.]|nr:MAG: hypothetical protein CM15mV11_2640 [Caudoviricetes sp.]